MKKTSLILTLLLLFTSNAWANYWNYDECGRYDQKPCLSKDGELLEGRHEKIGPMDSVQIAIHVKKGVLNGIYERYEYHGHPDGHIAFRANYKDGKLHGIAEEYDAYYSDGKLLIKYTYVEGELISFEEF